MMKGKDICALRKLHDNGVFDSVGAVILGDLRPKASRLHANHGIQLRIEIGGAAKDFRGDLEFLNRNARMIHGMLCQIAEQFAKGLRAMQGMAADEPIDLLEELLPFGHTSSLIRRSNRSVTSRATYCKTDSYRM